MFKWIKEIKRLKEENAALKSENEMLKKIEVEETKTDYAAVKAGGAVLYIPAREKEKIDREWRERNREG